MSSENLRISEDSILCLLRIKNCYACWTEIGLSQIVFLGDPNLQLFFGLADVLSGLLEPLLHFRYFLLNLLAAFCSVHLQKEMVLLLQGFYLKGECNNLSPIWLPSNSSRKISSSMTAI